MSADGIGYDRPMADELPMSSAEQRVRDATPAIIERIENGAKLFGAMAASGIRRGHAQRIIEVGEGGVPEVNDEGYRAACTELVEGMSEAMGRVDEKLATRWQQIAEETGDWRAIEALLKRRSPDEWNVTEKTQLELSGGVETRSEDAVLAALARLKGEASDADAG